MGPIQSSLNQLTLGIAGAAAGLAKGLKGKVSKPAQEPVQKETTQPDYGPTVLEGEQYDYTAKLGPRPYNKYAAALAAAKAVNSGNDAIMQKANSANAVANRLDQVNSMVERNAKADYFRKIGAEVSDDGVVTLYHATPEENIEKIQKEGFKGSEAPINGGFDEGYKPRSFFGHNEDWVKKTWSSDGEKKIMKVKIPAEYLHQAGKNKNEVFVEGNIKNQGDLWIPDTKPTSSAWSRILIKEFKKGGSK